MIGLISIVAIGFFLGMRHATDPDHVIAVTTIVSQQRNTARAALIGALWGLGHTLTIFIVGSAIIIFNLVIPPRIGLTMELSVGIMLIVLGGWNLASFMSAVPQDGNVPDSPRIPDADAFQGSRTEAGHSHDGHSHVHELTPPLSTVDRSLRRFHAYQFIRPLVIGIVHGLAGSAAVTLLILASIRDARWAIAYLLVFGIGTIAGMMLITMSIASAFRFVGRRFQAFGRRLALVSGVISVAFGALLAYEICIVQGLFTGNPIWTPR
jgi:ABC-type nickel/cobalt efflux system permease component RcnA